VKIKYLAHASFLISSEKGTKIVTDPYKTSQDLSYGEIKESADIVTMSHSHFDHNNVSAVKGSPQIISKPGKSNIKGIEFNGIDTYHDNEMGRARGNNTVFCFTVDGIRVCHLGDLGHNLDQNQLAAIGKVDILLIPVGGFYTIDAETASQVSDKLKPRVIIPMHYKTPKCGLPINGIDNFLKIKEVVTRKGESEIEFTAGKLPETTTVVVLKPAL
jgi:L-ascorbate metabolism protein UlaG (beta-lactamase superfamily)